MIEAFKNMETPSVVMLVSWLLFVLTSIYTYFRKPALTAYFLSAAAISIAAAFALFSPFLYVWDEQFHALVGKNLSQNMFIPKLYPQHLVQVQQSWLSTEIWMHKQPLFTWQIALSIKLFGTSAFAVRLPSVLFHGALVAAVFRMGILIFNRKTGFIAALIVMHSSFLLGLISGRVGTDHNDYIFLCYITLSFWAWFEWNQSAAKKWLYWIGIFAGCAILTKWLVGLIVFAGWGIIILSKLKRNNFWLSVKPFLVSLGTCFLIAAPWQIYTLLRFPAEARSEMAYNSEHVFKAVENHSGNAWYHFDQLRLLYFNPTDFLILFVAGLVFLIARKTKKDHKIYLLVSIGVIYLFFTIVKTKMPAFTAPVYALVALVIAFGITGFAALIPYKKVSKVILIALAILAVNWILKPSPTLAEYGLHKNKERIELRNRLTNALKFIQENGGNSHKRVVFGVDLYPFSHIAWMFFNDEIAYPFLPTENEVKVLEEKGYEVVVVNYK